MPGKTAAKSTTKRKTPAKASKTRALAIRPLSREEHEKAAYFNWLNRGAPAGDDQRDWFETMVR